MPSAEHHPRRHRSRIILQVEFGGSVLSGATMQVGMKLGRISRWLRRAGRALAMPTEATGRRFASPAGSLPARLGSARLGSARLRSTRPGNAPRPRRRGALDALARAVPAAGAGHVVNNNAAALALAATALAAGREIIVSRGELIEIGDGFRLPDLLESTGARIREVGTTNRTTLNDYRQAIGDGTAFILKLHPSNYLIEGFTSSVGVGELAGLGVLVVGDIGSGLLGPSPVLPDEPDADSWLRAGAGLVTASGDKLLGGPQAGLLLGQAETVTRLARHPLARALRVDKLTLAALEATLTGPAAPVTQALAATLASVRTRAEAQAGRLAGVGVDCQAVMTEAAVGGGGGPGVTLPSAALSLPERLAPELRCGASVRRGDVPAVVGRIEGGRLLLDLRAVAPADDERLAAAVLAAAAGDGAPSPAAPSPATPASADDGTAAGQE